MKALPFIERYRPRTLDGLIGNPEILARLRYFAAQGNLPNILFAGGPGLGKTTIALCLANQMLGAHRSVAFLELNRRTSVMSAISGPRSRPSPKSK